jgi:hypothetical protein
VGDARGRRLFRISEGDAFKDQSVLGHDHLRAKQPMCL